MFWAILKVPLLEFYESSETMANIFRKRMMTEKQEPEKDSVSYEDIASVLSA